MKKIMIDVEYILGIIDQYWRIEINTLEGVVDFVNAILLFENLEYRIYLGNWKNKESIIINYFVNNIINSDKITFTSACEGCNGIISKFSGAYSSTLELLNELNSSEI